MSGPRTVALVTAEIVGLEGVDLAVSIGDVARPARRAVSCLLEPHPGDRVVVSLVGDSAFVLHVLERGQGPATISSDRHLDVEAGGAVSIAAKGVEIVSGGPARLVARTVVTRVDALRARLAEALFVARGFVASVDELRAIGDLVERVAETTRRRYQRSIRHVEEDDRIEAGDVDVVATHEITLEAENATVTAETLVKSDAKQVQFG